MTTPDRLLLLALSHPDRLTGLSPGQWDMLLPRLRQAGLLARVHHALADCGALEAIAPEIAPHLRGAAIQAQDNQRKLTWEVNRLQRVLSGRVGPIILLKGAAYLLLDLPFARGRRSCDVDLMLPREQLLQAESLLLGAGWRSQVSDRYDQHYYRRWMHELPPLFHPQRQVTTDLHHTILPLTGRLRPDADRLLAAARPLPAEPRLHTLSPLDQVLHCAVHAFQDGDLNGRIGELADLQGLLSHYGPMPGFWDELPDRARELDLERPLYYALRYTRRLLGIELPAAVAPRLPRPGLIPLALMDLLAPRALLAGPHPGPLTALACRLLYIRSHWLRMPPTLLLAHLGRKGWRRLASRAAGDTG